MLNLVYELLFHDATFAISSEKSLNIVNLPHLPLYGLNWDQDYIYLGVAGVVASRAQWRFGIFAVGLQMAIKSSQVKSS